MLFTSCEDFGFPAQPLSMTHKYKVAVKEYLAKGKDGFDVFMVRPSPTRSTAPAT